jgi:hypothetical protein
VTLSVRLASVLELELPRNKATNNKINTAPPTTHTHGSAYQVSLVVVLVVMEVEELDEVSCANTTVCKRHSNTSVAKFFKGAQADNCFISNCFI